MSRKYRRVRRPDVRQGITTPLNVPESQRSSRPCWVTESVQNPGGIVMLDSTLFDVNPNNGAEKLRKANEAWKAVQAQTDAMMAAHGL